MQKPNINSFCSSRLFLVCVFVCVCVCGCGVYVFVRVCVVALCVMCAVNVVEDVDIFGCCDDVAVIFRMDVKSLAKALRDTIKQDKIKLDDEVVDYLSGLVEDEKVKNASRLCELIGEMLESYEAVKDEDEAMALCTKLFQKATGAEEKKPATKAVATSKPLAKATTAKTPIAKANSSATKTPTKATTTAATASGGGTKATKGMTVAQILKSVLVKMDPEVSLLSVLFLVVCSLSSLFYFSLFPL